MNALEAIIDLTLEADAGATRVWQDIALEHAFRVDVIADDEAEFDRVRAATVPLTSTMSIAWVIDRIPLARRPVHCGGLMAIEPSTGGNLKAWLAARVARVWRGKAVWRGRATALFRYVTRDGREVGKKQRWETRDYVDLAIGDSPAHLSGFTPGPDGKVKTRGVAAPRKTPEASAQALDLINRQFDFDGGVE